MAALLPSVFVLQSGGKYLSATENVPPATIPSGFLKFNEEHIWSPRVKFAVEPAKTTTGNGKLVHIRSCYNNKYLKMRQIGTKSYIVASAKNPEEDQRKESCTLFEPYSMDHQKSSAVCLRHVHTGISTSHWLNPDDDTHQGVLLSFTGSAFIVTNYSDEPKLPSKVAFRSEDLNGAYLRTISLYDNLLYQKFDPAVDLADQHVGKELIFTNYEGSYHIKDVYSGKFWRRRDGWIKSESEDPWGDADTLFTFHPIEDNVFAIRSWVHNNYCGAYTESESINCLRAFYPTLSKQTRLIVTELVLKRKISNLDYHLRRSRIYNQKAKEMSNAFATNNSPDKDATITLNFSTTVAKTTSWNNSVSTNFGVKVSFETSIVPLIESADIELSLEVGYTHEWGGSETTETKKEATYTVVVPPLTKIKVSMMCTEASCDVPFTYTKKDLPPTGDWVTDVLEDGIFTGMNSYNFYFENSVVT